MMAWHGHDNEDEHEHRRMGRLYYLIGTVSRVTFVMPGPKSELYCLWHAMTMSYGQLCRHGQSHFKCSFSRLVKNNTTPLQ